jgi:hypothetical protein
MLCTKEKNVTHQIKILRESPLISWLRRDLQKVTEFHVGLKSFESLVSAWKTKRTQSYKGGKVSNQNYQKIANYETKRRGRKEKRGKVPSQASDWRRSSAAEWRISIRENLIQL